MPCLVPFNNDKLDSSFFVFRSVGVIVEDLIEALKWFSFSCEDHGCAYSSVFRSIHGNLIIWYGAWIKRSSENRKILIVTLMSALEKMSNLAILVDYGFLEAYAGESKQKGLSAAKFVTGDTITMSSILPKSEVLSDDLSYACLAVLRSCFLKMDEVTSGVCFRCHDKPRVASLHVWKSLQSCYAWLLDSEHRKLIAPYIKHLAASVEYDVFRVAYVSSDDVVLNVHSDLSRQPQTTLGTTKDGKQEEEGVV